MHKVLFVCMGNICRSPTGEAVFRQFVAARGFEDRFHIDSAGTIAYHAGEPADPRMRRAASRRGYDLTSIARAVTRADLDEFDVVVAMDHDNFAELAQLGNDARAKLVLLGRFTPGAVTDHDAPPVPDPYYGGARGFDIVIDMIESACPRLFEFCLAEGSGRKE